MSGEWAKELFGPTLWVKASADAPPTATRTEEALAGKKFVGVYFSAHWCGPCRKFTPLLSVTYEDRDDKDEIEVVFVSSDSDLDSFNEYYSEMPWMAVPFEDRDRETALSTKFGVEGIPTFVVLDGATGALVDKEARAKVVAAKKLSGVFSK